LRDHFLGDSRADAIAIGGNVERPYCAALADLTGSRLIG
jgi:hypothetical protein